MKPSGFSIKTKSQPATGCIARGRDGYHTSTSQHGFSLVELLIAMTITLILLAGVVQIYTGSKQTYRSQEANSRLQESGRTATTILQRDIRSAGFQGCRSISEIKPGIIANAPIPTIDTNSVIRGYEGSGSGWDSPLPAGLGTVLSGTDVITIQHASSCGANLTGNLGPLNADIQVTYPNSCAFAANQVLIISDCTSADIFRASGVSVVGNNPDKQTVSHADNVNSSPKLSKSYGDDSEVLKLSSLTYFIATGANGQPSLWRYDNTSAAAAGVNPMELVSDVADMQIEYGVDTRSNIDGIPDYYTTADTVQASNNWDLVTSARISLLVQTPADNIATQKQTYTYNRTSVTAPDRRIYRVFTTTVSIRNKVS